MEEYKWIIYQIWWVNRTRFSSFILAHSLIILLVVFQQAVYEVDSYFLASTSMKSALEETWWTAHDTWQPECNFQYNNQIS